MIDSVLKHIYQHPDLRQEDLQRICNAHTRVEFKKGDCFLMKGKQANEYHVIENGLARAFIHDFNGHEITTDFIGTHEILIEVSSLFLRIPAQENLEALSAGVAYKIDFNVFQEIYRQSTGFNEWGRAWMSHQLFSLKQRHINMISESASDRYLSLLVNKPQVIQHASLKHIASYLGITSTSLSRIRKEIFHQ